MREKLGGFTLIELSLSIAFISILSITVVLIITNAISAYHRGITLNQVNTTGMDLVDDLRAAVQNSPARSVKSECASFYSTGSSGATRCENDNGRGFVSVTRRANVQSVGSVPVYGAFCTGSYSYIWNSGYFFTGEHTIAGSSAYPKADIRYKKVGDSSSQGHTFGDFKLLKVEDAERAVCKAAVGTNYSTDNINGGSNSNVFDIRNYIVLNEDPVDILAGSKSMVLYNLYSAAPADSSTFNNMFYAVSFVLGTIQGGANINTAGNYCAPPGDARENPDYCAINKFNFAAQANGG